MAYFIQSIVNSPKARLQAKRILLISDQTAVTILNTNLRIDIQLFKLFEGKVEPMLPSASSYQIAPYYCQFPPFSLLYCPTSTSSTIADQNFEDFLAIHRALEEEVVILREKVRSLEEEKESRADSANSLNVTAKSEKLPSSSQRIKFFPKDKQCPVRTCKRKYSSKIALNCHLRKKHRRANIETADYEP